MKMVGKGAEPKSSRIFQQCYLKCCKLQNLTPLNNVIPSGNGKVLDFCVDRIKYADWPPILNALSCDLSLHSVAIKCRNQVKTVLEHIDCERLAKTVNKRAVILTNFMLTNLIEATSQLMSNTTLLSSLTLEGLPLKIPYLNPLCEALLVNNSLQHLYLPRCLIGDAGCLAICKSVRCLPNILTLDLSGCDITPVGAGYIADLVKYQKIHRYSENWCHTLRYRTPELDTMAGLRRLTLCANPLAPAGAALLLDVLADDLWIKALDIQNCGLTEETAAAALRVLASNTTLVVLDLRHNADVSSDSLATLRAALRSNERGSGGQFSWLSTLSRSSTEIKLVKQNSVKNGVIRDRTASNTRNIPTKYISKSTVVKKEKDYTETLEEQLQEEISHRQQLEELNLQLVDQMKQLKQQQIPLWANGTASSGSEHSLEASSRSLISSSSGSSSSVPIDQNTLAYIQQAFKDIYMFIKNNQCYGQCEEAKRQLPEPGAQATEGADSETDHREAHKAQSSHAPIAPRARDKASRSAHLLGQPPIDRAPHQAQMAKPDIIERQIGDTKNVHAERLHIFEDMMSVQKKPKKPRRHDKSSSSAGSACSAGSVRSACSAGSDSDTLVLSPQPQPRAALAINPRDALVSSSEDEDAYDDDDERD